LKKRLSSPCFSGNASLYRPTATSKVGNWYKTCLGATSKIGNACRKSLNAISKVGNAYKTCLCATSKIGNAYKTCMDATSEIRKACRKPLSAISKIGKAHWMIPCAILNFPNAILPKLTTKTQRHRGKMPGVTLPAFVPRCLSGSKSPSYRPSMVNSPE
jgi:hypothetical protein